MRIAENYGQALYRATAGMKEKDAEKAIGRFVALLASRHETHLAPKIIEAYGKAARRAEGIRDVRVASAEGLTADRKKQLAAAFAKTLGAPVDVRWETDPSLIAGAVIRYDDVLLDASAKGSLDRLKKRLS